MPTPISRAALAACVLVLLAGACAATDPYESAQARAPQGECEEAAAGYTKALERASNDHELARAYYFRSLCREELGETGPAYADAYAALRVSCYLAATERTQRTRPLGFIIGPAYCRGEGPARLADLGERLSRQEAGTLRRAVDQELPARIRASPLPDQAR